MSTSVRSSHPISFSLLNDDAQPVMDIVDGAEGRDMKLEITNNSRRAMKLAGEAGAAAATPDKHHFELRFRPGTLNPAAQISVDGGNEGWLISKPGQTNGPVSLYLLNKNEVSLAAGASLSLTLRHVSADGRGGARGTRVELKYRGLQYVSGQVSEPLADGEREQHLSIVNQRGKKTVPLHFGVVGSNTILNDGKTKNDRIIKITNTLKEGSLPLSAAPLSRFILSFDVYDSNEKNEWALGTNDVVKAIEVEAVQNSTLTDEQKRARLNQELGSLSQQLSPGHKKNLAEKNSDSERVEYLVALHTQGDLKVSDKWIVWKNAQGATVEWTIMPTKDKTFLDKGESIQFSLKGIISNMRSGPTNVYLRYENLPGYWDGQFIATLEKSNLVQRDQLDNGNYTQQSNVGIGTDAPQQRLEIHDGDGLIQMGRTAPTLVKGSNNGGAIYFGVDRTGNNDWPTAAIETSWGGGSIPQIGIGVTREFSKRPGANILMDFNGDTNIRKGEKSRLFVQGETGNVGIGTSEPQAKLSVTSSDDVAALRLTEADKYTLDIGSGGNGIALIIGRKGSRLAFGTNNSEKMRIDLNGNVGIGTSEPQAKLSVTSSDDVAALRLTEADKYTLDIGSRGNGVAFIRGNEGTSLAFGTNYSVTNDSEKMRIDLNGNVGIGTNDPKNKLDVSGDVAIRGKHAIRGDDDWLRLNQDGAFTHGILTPRLFTSRSLIVGKVNNWSDPGAGNVCVLGKVGIGIGTNTPTVPLEVRSFENYDLGGGFWFAFRDDQRNAHEGSHVNAISIKTSAGIQSEYGVFVTSDLRIKKELKKSDPDTDLEILSQLQVTDYKHIDFVHHGDKHKKGLIAQQVEKVFPQAIIKQTDVIPDIYQPAAFADGWVLLATDLQKGERIRLISEKAEGIYEVLEAATDKFRTDFKPEGEKVFVFGREVDDFRILDYDAISMLNVSATQQLKKEKDEEVKVLRTEITDLKSANDALQKRLTLLESRLETSPSVVVAKNGSSGNGTH